jgi:hypothetical protein
VNAAFGSIGFSLALLSPMRQITRMIPKSQNFGRAFPKPRGLCLIRRMTLIAELLPFVDGRTI